MRRLSFAACALIAAFMLLMFAARAIGRTQPPPQVIAALHLSDCTLPCWLGITPGKTTFKDAVQRVSAAYPQTVDASKYGNVVGATYQTGGSDGQIAVFADDDGIVRQITLYTSAAQGMMLGDIVNLYGLPGCMRKSPLELTYRSANALAGVLANSELQDRWRHSINNIRIHRFDGDKNIQCGTSMR